MDPLSGVASIIAVIQIAEDILGLFGSYISAVKDAKRDIERLSAEVLALRNILRKLEDLKQEPGSAKLATLNLLNKPGGAVEKCLEELKELATRLDPGQGDSAMRRVGWRALKWPFSSKDVDKKILIMERYKTAFNLALTTDNTTLILNMELEVTHINEGITHIDESIMHIDDGVTRIDQGVMELRQAATAVRTDTATSKALETRNEIIGWLANTDPSSNHYAACKKHQAGTGKWFVEGSGMKEWKRQNSLLWLYGIPGCGKTILSSNIIENINEFCILNPGNAVAYYYFSFNDSEKQIAVNFISSVVAQLCMQVVDLPEELKGLYSRCNDGERKAAMPNLKAILKPFTMMKKLQNIFMVIDALDECPRDGDREEVLGLIAEMKTWSPSNLHLLVTSRQETDIDEKLVTLLTAPAISIQGPQVASDIELYVNDQIATVTKWKQLKVGLKLEIKETLVKGANGMFRWVFCQLEALKKCPPLQDPIRKALKNLPATLDETYERILVNIHDEDSQQIARRSLLWLAFSERPLYLKELAEAAVIDTQFSDPERLPDPRYILELLGSLVTISLKGVPNDDDQDDSIEASWDSLEENLWNNPKDVPGEAIRLAHFSVKEYLVSKRIQSGKASIFGVTDVDAHRFIAEICLLYILHYDQSGSKTISPEDLEIFPILQYACEFWYIHRDLISVETQKAIDPIIFKLFLSDTALLSWLRVHRPNEPWKKPFEIPDNIGSPLYHASDIGLEAVVRLLIEAKADVDTKDNGGQTALMRAAVNGHEEVVRLLIEAKADVDAKDPRSWTALMRAAVERHKAVVRLLIEAEADVDVKDDKGWTVLMWAATSGHEEVVRLLIEAKADVDAKDPRGWTALMRATANGHEEVVRLLIEAKADVDAKDPRGWTALMRAATSGHEAVVRLLIEAKADVDAKDSWGQTALMKAANNGHEAVVLLLIEAKVDP